MLARLLLLLSALTSTGCDGSPAPLPTRTIQNGVSVVRNHAPQWSPGQGWLFVEEFRVGEDEDDFLADAPALALGPRGVLALLDIGANEVRLYDAGGALITRFGSEGQGPGEFRSPFAMGWDGDERLWIANAFDGRFNVYDVEGEFAKSAPRPIHGRNAKISRLVFTEDGSRFWDEKNRPDGAPSPILIDTAGVVVDSTPTIPHEPFPEGARGIVLRRGTAFFTLTDLNFLPRTRWAIHPSGLRWSTAVGDTRLFLTDPEGDTLQVVHREHAARQITGRWRRLVAEAERESGADPAWFSRPLVQSLAVTSDGYVVVAVVGEPHLASEALEVYSPEGVFLGRIDLDFPLDRLARMEIRQGRVAVVARLEYDIPVVIVGRLHRP